METIAEEVDRIKKIAYHEQEVPKEETDQHLRTLWQNLRRNSDSIVRRAYQHLIR